MLDGRGGRWGGVMGGGPKGGGMCLWCGSAGRSGKGPVGDRPGAEGAGAMKLSAEPPKIRGDSSQLD